MCLITAPTSVNPAPTSVIPAKAGIQYALCQDRVVALAHLRTPA